MVITRATNASPDMILTAFDLKFHETKDEIPPRACRPSTKTEKNYVQEVDHQKVKQQNNLEKVDTHKAEKKLSRTSGFIYSYISSYTFIYLHIPLNSFIYLHIPSHTSKY